VREKVSFGFRDVSPDEKTSLVRGVFSQVASRYDLMNDVMSFGVHRLWKDILIERIHPEKNQHLLDVAGGTGDIAFRFLKAAPQTHVTVCDINQDMLTVGCQREEAKKLRHRLNWVCADASSLPLNSDMFDVYTISFGLRNVTDIPGALREAYRVLKPGGIYFCLEFSKVTLPFLDHLYHHYRFRVIPKLGQWIAQEAQPYQYLAESIERFPKQDILQKMIQDAGFAHTSYENLWGGMAAIHKGWKL